MRTTSGRLPVNAVCTTSSSSVPACRANLINRRSPIARAGSHSVPIAPYEFRCVRRHGNVRNGAALRSARRVTSHQSRHWQGALIEQAGERISSPRDRQCVLASIRALPAMSYHLRARDTWELRAAVITAPDSSPPEAKLQKLLGLRSQRAQDLLIAFGYADPSTLLFFSRSKGFEYVSQLNRWGE